MRTPIAWQNTLQDKVRTIVALGGVSFSILLIFMQVGFLDAARKNASIVFPFLDFDLIVISSAYLTLPRSDSINPYRTIQAASVVGVREAESMFISAAEWENPQTGSNESCMVFGVDPGSAPFNPDRTLDLRPLRQPRSMLVDRLSSKNFGPWATGDQILVNATPLIVSGSYALGTGLLSDGSIIVSQDTFGRLFGPAIASRPNFALLRLEPGAEPEEVRERVSRILPPDVRVLTAGDIIRREQRYFINVKPIGIMFKVGAAVAFLVGAVILYQVLSSEITRRLNEFATLKAMGYRNSYIYGVGLQQGFFFGFLGFLPAAILSALLYRMIRDLAGLPLYMEWNRTLLVLSLTALMCGLAAVLSLRKIKRADPAELF